MERAGAPLPFSSLMNNRTRVSLALACVVAVTAMTLVSPAVSVASTTTTILSESFGSTSFPPAGWTVGPRNYGASQPCSYATQPGWYRSSGNPGGVAGVGSAVCWTFGAYSQNCYGTPTYGPCMMTTPTLNLSGVAVSGDSQYVDFDIYMAASYYDRNSASYSNYMGHLVDVMNGSTVIQTYKAYGTSGDWTVYTGRSGLCLSDPSSYNSTIYWKHVRLALGSQTGSMQLTFRVRMQATSCVYSYWYSENVAITNVKVTSTHYDMLTMNGPASLSFGRVPYQTSSPTMYTSISNNSSRIINLTNYQLIGAQAGDYSIVYMPSSIGIGVKDSIGVVFTPQGSGGRLATLQFNTDADLPTTVTIPLSGYGLQPAIALPQGLVPLFTQQHVRFGASRTATLLIQNTGEVPLHIYPDSSFFAGDYPQFYSVVRWPAAAIAGGTSDSIVLSFSPYIEGMMTAQFSIASDALNGMQTVNLRGIGILPHLVITTNQASNGSSVPSVVNFGSVAIGDSICQTMMLHNIGSDTLSLQKQIVTYGDYDFTFSLLSGADVNLAPDASKLVNVCFKPLQRGIRMASVRFYTNISPTYPANADTSQFLVQVTGNGVPYGKLAVSGLMNDSAIVGQTNCVNDTIWNTGAADLSITSAKLTGTNASDFALSGVTMPLVIAAGKFQAFQICYTPKLRGLSNASLDVVGTSADRTMNQSLAVLGVGQVACMDPAPNPVAFGSTQYPGVTLAKTGHDTTCVTVTNCGDVAMSFTATLAAGSSSNYALTTASTPVIAAGSTGTICIAYSPDSLGASSGNLTITPSESSLSAVTLPLNGSGAGVIVMPSGQPMATSMGQCDTFDVILQNSGNVAWTPGTATISGSNDFAVVSALAPPTIAPGAMGTMKVSFCPTSASTTAQLSFNAAAPLPLVGVPYQLTGVASSAGVSIRSEQNGFSIGPVYPNPTSSSASVIVTAPRSAKATVTLVRLDGSEIANIYDGMLSEGEQMLTIDAKRIPSGTYFCMLRAGDIRVMREIVVLK